MLFDHNLQDDNISDMNKCTSTNITLQKKWTLNKRNIKRRLDITKEKSW